MRLNQLFEESGKTVAVTFGRLNPPTIGHEKLINAVLKQSADAHYLFVSKTEKTTGKNKVRFSNPIPYNQKLGFIQQAFPNIEIGDTSISTAIAMLQHLEQQGFENVIFVAGSDRTSEFEQLFNKQNGVDYNLKSIKVVSSGDRDPDAEGTEGMSASKMRQAVIDGEFEKFKSNLPATLQSNSEEVYNAVKAGLEPWISETFPEGDVDEGWKSALAGAALAGATALGGAAQAAEPVGPLPVMATIKMELPDGSTKVIKKDLGHSYDYKLEDAKKDIENLLDRKGIKKYTIHLDRYQGDTTVKDKDTEKNYSDKSYLDTGPYTDKGGSKDYMDRSPLTTKSPKSSYFDKASGKEFRDMGNY